MKHIRGLLSAGVVQALSWIALGVVLAVLWQRWPLFPAHLDDEPPTVNPFASCPEKLSAAERERRTLREEVAYLKQSVMIEQQACFELREGMKGHQDQLAKLNEQLAFYRGIVSPEEDAAGMRIHNLELFRSGQRDWQFRLTLIQAVRHAKDAKGLVKIRLEGLKNNVFTSYGMKEIDPAKEYTGLYQFRHYLEKHGQFRLPAGFSPLRIVVEAIPEARGSKSVTRTWVWQEIITADKAEAS